MARRFLLARPVKFCQEKNVWKGNPKFSTIGRCASDLNCLSIGTPGLFLVITVLYITSNIFPCTRLAKTLHVTVYAPANNICVNDSPIFKTANAANNMRKTLHCTLHTVASIFVRK